MNVKPQVDWTLYPDGWAPSSTYFMPSDWNKAQWRVAVNLACVED